MLVRHKQPDKRYIGREGGLAGQLVQPKSRRDTHMKPTRTLLLGAFGLALMVVPVNAEMWPTKPLRVIVPVGAGSTTDIIPRAVFEELSRQIGQTIVVENRVGAGGTIGSAFVARADPDGYTILAHGSAHTIAPSLYPNLSYDPAHDFAAVVPLGVSASVLALSPPRGFNSAA